MSGEDWGWSGVRFQQAGVDWYCPSYGREMTMQKLVTLKQQRGITGIETAIILIAFVIVASVFAYVVLSAGLFSFAASAVPQAFKPQAYAEVYHIKSASQISGENSSPCAARRYGFCENKSGRGVDCVVKCSIEWMMN